MEQEKVAILLVTSLKRVDRWDDVPAAVHASREAVDVIDDAIVSSDQAFGQ